MKLWFELSWKQQEMAGPPLQLLDATQDSYTIMSFELTSEAHH
jgi:hypothetical protein